jgi:hypothetical protein
VDAQLVHLDMHAARFAGSGIEVEKALRPHKERDHLAHAQKNVRNVAEG